MSDYTPKPFTDAQRDLFQTVAKLHRSKPDDFAEADQWIDAKPKTERQKFAEYRQRCKDEGRERREFHPTRYLDLSGEQIQAWMRLARLEPKYNLLDPVAVIDEWVNCGAHSEPAFFDFTSSATRLRKWRRDRGRTIRYALKGFRERIKEEDEHGPLKPHELIDMAASRFMHTNDPIVFDAMNPQLKALWARRLLRLVWILTDTADLTATKLGWLRDWKWGEFAVEFLVAVDGKCLPIPRLWLRVTTFDRDLQEWEQLTRNALRALEEAEPGATKLLDLQTRAVRENGEQTDYQGRLPLSDLQQDVWNILKQHTATYNQDGVPSKCLSGNEICDRLSEIGINQSPKSVADVIAEIRKKRWPVLNQRGSGYFIPPQTEVKQPIEVKGGNA